jgi:hypothetical protein
VGIRERIEKSRKETQRRNIKKKYKEEMQRRNTKNKHNKALVKA